MNGRPIYATLQTLAKEIDQHGGNAALSAWQDCFAECFPALHQWYWGAGERGLEALYTVYFPSTRRGDWETLERAEFRARNTVENPPLVIF